MLRTISRPATVAVCTLAIVGASAGAAFAGSARGSLYLTRKGGTCTRCHDGERAYGSREPTCRP